MNGGAAVLEQALFESEFAAPAVALVVGVIAGFALAQRGKRKSGVIAVLVGMVAAGGLAASSRLVETDREVVSERTEALVAAFAAGDPSAVEGYLSERLVVAAGGEQIRGVDRGLVLGGVETVERVVTGLSPTVRSPERTAEGEVTLELGVRADLAMGGISPSTWSLTWQEEGGAWRVVRIEALRLGGQVASPGNFPRWSNSRGF